VVAQRLAHAHFPVGARQDAEDDPDVRLLPKRGHHLAAGSDNVEELIRATHLDISVQMIRIVSLHDRVEKLVQVDRLIFVPAFVKVIAGQELLDREIGCQVDEVRHGKFTEPLIIVKHLSAFRIENAKSLLSISAGVFHDFFLAQVGAKFVFV